ncbi:ZIP family metal transporter [Haloquadratum walsbyi]|uniref:Putative divalent heavy-metal cations transporter n=1 Tax=Haloquadratum walsbyi J07HQW2 TaxID=1238425 RepID=U1PK51_9EURY|nr:ZIP family metal transporter [Haloquadratum walsbyi]ERG94052.1 MAG: putative divalent heavy-metal cations transporter [Haloquadratum walsbyi J07HQW2]
MVVLAHLALVFIAGLATALATGLGAIPFFFVEDFSDRWNVGLWGVASGIMVAASLFGLINEGMQYASDGFPVLMLTGLLIGVALVEGSGRVLSRIDINATDPDENGHGDDGYPRDEGNKQADPTPDIGTDGGPEAIPEIESQEYDDNPLEAKAFADGDVKTLLLILGILTVHSFPEGVAVGVSFAEIGFDGGIGIFGIAIPLLAVFMTVAISIHNIPEGTAIAIPMRAMGLSKWRMVGAAVFSSLPQPIGAVIAFAFVTWAESFLPFGFGFAAGAMIYLVVTEFIPEALETGADLEHGGYRALAGGVIAGVAVMIPLLYV